MSDSERMSAAGALHDARHARDDVRVLEARARSAPRSSGACVPARSAPCGSAGETTTTAAEHLAGVVDALGERRRPRRRGGGRARPGPRIASRTRVALELGRAVRRAEDAPPGERRAGGRARRRGSGRRGRARGRCRGRRRATSATSAAIRGAPLAARRVRRVDVRRDRGSRGSRAETGTGRRRTDVRSGSRPRRSR